MRKFRGIVKVQRPITTNGDYHELLIYSEGRAVMLPYIATKKEIKQLFPHNEYKTYWLAEGVDGGLLNFVEQVEEQDW